MIHVKCEKSPVISSLSRNLLSPFTQSIRSIERIKKSTKFASKHPNSIILKIVYYTDQTYLHGGIERVLANKINYLVDQEEIEVHLITTEQKGKPHCYPISSKLISHDLGINYHRSISYFKPINLKKVPAHIFKLKKLLNKLQPDVVVVCNYDFAFYFIPFLQNKSSKIKEYHGSRYFESAKRKENQSVIKKLVYRLNDLIESKYNYVALLTPDEKKFFKSNNTVVIPNGIDILYDKRSSLTNTKVISAGRIAPVKGFDKLIDAWRKVAVKYPNWQLEIYGDGENEYIAHLQKQIIEANLETQICLCGQTDDLFGKILSSSLYVMSSKTECFPMVLLETQTCGLPIVSFDCPYGPKNIITDNQDGILVENQNSSKLADAIMRLIASENLRKEMGKKAKENVRKFEQSIILKQWIDLFNEQQTSTPSASSGQAIENCD